MINIQEVSHNHSTVSSDGDAPAIAAPLIRGRLGQDLDVPVRSVHADPLPVPDQLGGMLHSRAITAPWVIRPPTSVTRPLMATNAGVQLGSV